MSTGNPWPTIPRYTKKETVKKSRSTKKNKSMLHLSKTEAAAIGLVAVAFMSGLCMKTASSYKQAVKEIKEARENLTYFEIKKNEYKKAS